MYQKDPRDGHRRRQSMDLQVHTRLITLALALSAAKFFPFCKIASDFFKPQVVI